MAWFTFFLESEEAKLLKQSNVFINLLGKMQNEILSFFCKNELRKAYDQKKKCSETEYILQTGTFIFFSSQDLHYLFSHMEFVSEKIKLEIGFPRLHIIPLS